MVDVEDPASAPRFSDQYVAEMEKLMEMHVGQDARMYFIIITHRKLYKIDMLFKICKKL